MTKLLCQDLAQHNTVYSSFSRSFLSFPSKFLILYVRSIKQLNIYVAFPAPLQGKAKRGTSQSAGQKMGKLEVLVESERAVENGCR